MGSRSWGHSEECGMGCRMSHCPMDSVGGGVLTAPRPGVGAGTFGATGPARPTRCRHQLSHGLIGRCLAFGICKIGWPGHVAGG